MEHVLGEKSELCDGMNCTEDVAINSAHCNSRQRFLNVLVAPPPSLLQGANAIWPVLCPDLQLKDREASIKLHCPHYVRHPLHTVIIIKFMPLVESIRC